MPFMVTTHKKEGLHREIFASSIEKSAAFNKSGEEEKASSGASKLQVYMTKVNQQASLITSILSTKEGGHISTSWVLIQVTKYFIK